MGIVTILVAALTAGIAWAAPGDIVQTTEGTVSGKLSKKKFKNAGIKVVTTLQLEDQPDERPPAAKRAVITFDKDLKFNTKGKPVCKANLANTTTEQAKKACGKSQVGKGVATVEVGSGTNEQGAVVTAFNGKGTKRAGKLFLHVRLNNLPVTNVLTGTLKGKVLDVRIPENPGVSLTRFETTVRKGNYVQAKCPDKKFNIKGVFTYEDGRKATATSSSTCKAG
ncbi:hypothetical protein HJD18_12955 [Thermoleophilia bacterium SCSIO 60948]|nr:hypothetical protein HJD18_12955 [Thermoleophilia bacterium SCSIO 60948]